MRKGSAVAVLVAGVLLFVVLLGVKRSEQAFSLGVAPNTPLGVKPGQEGCQTPIDVPKGAAFDSVRIPLQTYGAPGPELRVTIRDARGRTVTRHTVRKGYRDGTIDVPVGRSLSGRGYAVCVTNRGTNDVGLTGTGGGAAPFSAFILDGGEDTTTDVSLTFGRPARSLLAGVPDVLDRATLFRSPRLSGVLYGLLLALLLVGAGAATVAALRAAEAADGEDTVTGAGDPASPTAPREPWAGEPHEDWAEGPDDTPGEDAPQGDASGEPRDQPGRGPA
jgi:hypothetical protein